MQQAHNNIYLDNRQTHQADMHAVARFAVDMLQYGEMYINTNKFAPCPNMIDQVLNNKE
jgi:hypothetical protein